MPYALPRADYRPTRLMSIKKAGGRRPFGRLRTGRREEPEGTQQTVPLVRGGGGPSTGSGSRWGMVLRIRLGLGFYFGSWILDLGLFGQIANVIDIKNKLDRKTVKC